MRTLLSILTLTCTMTFANAGDFTGPLISDLANRALKKGHGTECSLKFEPTKNRGYYPCLDFGPYRYVKAYGKSFVFVIQANKSPFKIMEGSYESLSFIHDGPWNSDVGPRLALWWNDVVEGNALKFEMDSAETKARTEAADYISSLNPKTEDIVEHEEQSQSRVGESISVEIEKILSH